MIYFGNPATPEIVQAMQDGLLGLITTPNQGNKKPDGVAWCADNGCFGKGYPGDEAWRGWLSRQTNIEDCWFATAPDVVGDAAATIERSLPHFDFIRECGYRVAFVGQDGLEDLEVPWDGFDCLFLGGSTKWKLSKEAAALSKEAVRRGKTSHMGRVNSFKRMNIAHLAGCTSVDGTYLTFKPSEHLASVIDWTRKINDPAYRLASWFDD
jgi:hypothetical protein